MTPSSITLFKTMQAEKLAADPGFRPLNIACVFSPPADGDPDVKQIQEDLPQEKEDNAVEPEKKKEALKAILADYNAHYGTNHKIGEFDLYYQDVQKRIKDQQWPDADLKKAYPNQPHHKIDITIVVDMLLTGFDSKFLNTLYVDKNLKHHGLIQAFSRTNRVLNATKPYGNILDFRQQQGASMPPSPSSRARPPPKRPAKSGWSTRPPWSSRNWKPRSRSSTPS
jgi:type I restriction enzyme, R subunit